MQNDSPRTASFSKLIRVLTVAPLMALVALSILYLTKPAIFDSLANYLSSLIFLVALPLLAYPLQPLLPYFKKKGREGQRNLAIIMAVVGYIAGIVWVATTDAPTSLWLIYLTYFVSGIGIVIFNKLLHVRASGHACGVAGPIAIMVYFFGWWALAGLPLLALVFYTSIRMKRHTLPQLICGSLISILAMLFSAICLRWPFA